MIAGLARKAFASAFIRNATLLSSGVILAQSIPLLTLPFFSRMFDPGFFALHGLLLMGMAVLVPIATGFYEWAIPIPRQQAQARSLATFVILLAVMLSTLLLVALKLFRDPIVDVLQLEPLGPWIIAYPTLILFTALINVANYWLLRQGKLGLQTVNRVALTGSIALFTFAFGIMNVKSGLLLGFIIGTTVAGIWAIGQAWRSNLRIRWPLPKNYTRLMLGKYREFPLFGSIPTAINNFAIYVPVLLVTSHYALDTSGHYAVTRNLLAGGLGLIAAAIGQVVLKHVAERAQKRERIWPHYLRMMGLLLAAGFALSVGVYFVGPWFFQLYLGQGWENTAIIARMLSFNLMLWLVAPALAQTVIAMRKVKPVALWQVGYGIGACCLFFLDDRPFLEFLTLIVWFEIGAYALYLLIITYTVKHLEKAG